MYKFITYALTFLNLILSAKVAKNPSDFYAKVMKILSDIGSQVSP